MKTYTFIHRKPWVLIKGFFAFLLLLAITANYVAWGQTTVTIGAGTGYSSNNTISPYSTQYMDGRNQLLILASEITAAGGQAGTITQFGIQIYAVGGQPMNGLTISMKQTAVAVLTTTYETGLTTVYSNAAYTPAGTGWQMLTLDLPFAWNGTSNILVQICFDNTTFTTSSSVYYSTTATNLHHYGYMDNDAGCTMIAPANNGINTSRANMRLYFDCTTPAGMTTSTAYYLTNVTTTGGTTNINNTSTFAAGGYNDYYSGAYCTAAPGSMVNITLTTNQLDHHYYIWIDYNNDGDYLDTDETVLATTGYTIGYTLAYTVPVTIAPGTYRMRVANSYTGTITPCGPAPYGEYEDYKFVVCTCPANETCSTPTYISYYSSSYSASGVLGCTDDCTGGAYNDVFYRIIPQATGSYTVDMGNSSGDTYMRVYSGSCCGTLVATGDDEFGDLDPQITLTLTAGTNYYFECGSYSSSTLMANQPYNFHLVRNCDSIPPNETCAGARYISGSISSYHTSGILGCSDDCTGTPLADVFYYFTPHATGSYTIDMGLSEGDTYIDIYSGSCCTGTLVASGDQEYGGADPSVTVTLTGGTTYYFECGSWSNGMENAAFNLNVVRNCPSVPANEECAGAISISNYSLPYNTSNVLGCTNDCAGPAYFDVFYSFTPIYTGSYTADMGSSDGDTYMKVYSGTCCTGTVVATGDQELGDDASVTLTLTGGTTYYFECGSYFSTGYANAPYNFHLTRNCAPQTNETCAGATVISSTISTYGISDTLGCTNDCVSYPYYDVFYSFTPQATGSYTADMYLSQGDTYMKLYSGSCCGTLIASNDDGAGDMDPIITYTLTAGTTYYFELGSLSSSEYMSNTVFNFNLVRNCDSVPPNETCAGAINITNASIPYTTNGLLGITNDCASYPYNDVFYTFTPLVTGSYTADMAGSDGNTEMKLYEGTCCSTFLAYDDNSAGGLDPQITYTLTGGTTYYFECGSWYSTGYCNAPFTFHLVRNCSTPANETCAGATSISFAQIAAGYNTSGTLGCTDDCASFPYHDVFFRYNCTMTGIYTFDMRNSDGNTEMKIFSGSCCGTQIAYDDNSYGGSDPLITVTMTAGTSYWIECGNFYNSDYYTGTAYNLYASYKPWNDECTAVTPAPLSVGSPLTFSGNNTNATTDCSLLSWATVWYAFTTTECADVVVDFCSTSPAFGEVGVVLTQCTCSSLIYSYIYNTTECSDGNYKVYFNNLPAGTYYYPVFSNASTVGPYTMHITANYPTSVPTTVTATPSLILCGNGSSELNATSPGNNINWYTVATGGTPFASTASGVNVLVSPAITSTYYAEASEGGNNDTITTLYASNNNKNGCMFDVNVLQNITVSSFDVNLTTGATSDFAVYYKTGTFVGFESNSGAWTLIGTAANIVSNGTNAITPLNLNLNLHLTAGQTYAFYITTTSVGNLQYSNGTAVGNIYSSNSQIQVKEGIGIGYPFGSIYTPRIFNGTIHYSSGACVSARTPVTVTVTSAPNAPTPVTATPSAICNGSTSQLNATSVGNAIDWYAAATGGTALGTSNSGVDYQVSPTTTTTYYAEAEATHASTVGPLNPENTGALSTTTLTVQYLIFDVSNRASKIVSVDIFPTAAVGSAFSILILDPGGNQIYTTGSQLTTVTGGNKQTVPINFIVPVGTSYRMQMGVNPGLNRNSTGAVYPYTNGNISITGNSFSPGYYYFCYNWQIETACPSTRTPVTVTVNPVNTIALTAGGTQTKCINNAITTTTYTTTGATGATVTGLPTGVTGSWAADVVTISGTPTVSGPFTYTVTLTGGCGVVTASGTITVTPANTITLTAGGTQTKCINTAITTTTYSTTGATGATVTGLPTGVTGNWAADVVTISGTPTVSGPFNYTITLTGGCGTATATGTITVTPTVTPTFTVLGPYCVGATPGILPSTSTNGITGTWDPNIISVATAGTTSYAFTPTAGLCAIPITMDVTINTCTGIGSIDERIIMSVTPNPSNGMFYLTVKGIEGDAVLSVYAISGQVIYTEQVNFSGLVIKPIDLKSFSKGIYFINLISNEISRTEKIIIE